MQLVELRNYMQSSGSPKLIPKQVAEKAGENVPVTASEDDFSRSFD